MKTLVEKTNRPKSTLFPYFKSPEIPISNKGLKKINTTFAAKV